MIFMIFCAWVHPDKKEERLQVGNRTVQIFFKSDIPVIPSSGTIYERDYFTGVVLH